METLNVTISVVLEKDFTKKEIFDAFVSLAREKLSRPNGFPMVIYQKSPSFMKSEILAVVEEFQ